jgi:diguanylate cyclase (GGDEF)-like protein
LEQACVAAREDDSHVAVLLLDVDLFKQINDRHGHASGDDALRQVSAVAARNVPQGGLVARLGGDELALLLPGLDAYDAAAVAERVRSEVSENVSLDEGKVTVSVSLGVAAERGSAIVATRLMAAADKELYRAKSSRNSVSAPHFSTAGLPTQRTPHEEMRRIRS